MYNQYLLYFEYLSLHILCTGRYKIGHHFPKFIKFSCFLKTADICELLEVKQTSAYEIIGNLNKELEEQGYLTLRGKVPTKYFVKRFYGVEDTCEIPQEEGKEWFHA